MTSNDILYKVKADNGLGGTVFGRDAADELVARLGSRPDVVSVEAEPVKVAWADSPALPKTARERRIDEWAKSR